MINMLSLRSFRLATTTGHVVHFKANTPTPVPDAAVQAAMNAGCVPVDKEDQPFIDDLNRVKIEFVGNMRKSLIFLAMDVLSRENSPKNFDGGGRPKTEVLTERLGFDVPAKERTAVWQDYMTAKNGGGEFQLHSEAEAAMECITATDLEELRTLAVTNGFTAEQTNGLSSRDLRTLLLSKFSGIAAG